MPSLPDVLQVASSLGGLFGAAIAVAINPRSDRELIENIVLGAALGAVAGVWIAAPIWVVLRLTGSG
jgi:zinc transporter ZupT